MWETHLNWSSFEQESCERNRTTENEYRMRRGKRTECEPTTILGDYNIPVVSAHQQTGMKRIQEECALLRRRICDSHRATEKKGGFKLKQSESK
ncbi:hypothetical protein M413DRAFT_346003 [Hebeloma cylindrosporum]|uniref:Uncharacterized protein n=1 Tax=Hebeloma cylindrosporum TaxID=76867 RepID=A0A0C3CNQ9_HEBCY|nr:hypothetical protein M413DRAFT_346003 [Hebeloma cylindrosporum h7]